MLFLNAHRTDSEPTAAVEVVVGVLLEEAQVASVVLVLPVERRRRVEAAVAHIADM